MNYLQAILDTVPAFISYVDRSFRYRAVSRHYERLFHQNHADILGREVRHIIGESAWEQIVPAVKSAIAGQPTPFQADIDLPILGKRFSSGIVTPDRDEDGYVRGVVILVEDTTEEKRTRLVLSEIEAYYQSLFSNPVVAHAEVEINTLRFLRVNQAMCDMLGYHEDELIGIKTVFDITHPDDLERNGQVVSPIVNRESDHSQLEKRYIRKDGTTIWVSVSGATLKGLNGAHDKIFGTVQDISARKRAENLLIQSERNKDEFIATLAHELRNPLGAISNTVQLWSRSAPAPDKLEAIRDIINRQVNQLKHLIGDLLDLTRISEGKIRLHPEVFDLKRPIESAIESTGPLFEAREHSLTSECSEHSILVKADLGRITQVFINLLNNAAKYTPKGGTISVCINRVAPRTAQIIIRDSGLGIASEMLERIFQQFVQVDSAHCHNQGGLGIGLTLTRKIMELHQGSLVARSEGLGKGSEFVVTLPTLEN